MIRTTKTGRDGKRSVTLLTATLTLVLACIIGVASLSAQGRVDPPAGGNAAEAEFHYKVALAALRDNNLDIARSELEQAARLAPNNALVEYNLAIVYQKAGEPAAGLASLGRAMSLGLPTSELAAAGDLRAALTYEMQKLRTAVVGAWGGQRQFADGTLTTDFDFDSAANFSASVMWAPVQGRICLFTQKGTYRVVADGKQLFSRLEIRFDSENCSDDGRLRAVTQMLFPSARVGSDANHRIDSPDANSLNIGPILNLTRRVGTTDTDLRRGATQVVSASERSEARNTANTLSQAAERLSGDWDCLRRSQELVVGDLLVNAGFDRVRFEAASDGSLIAQIVEGGMVSTWFNNYKDLLAGKAKAPIKRSIWDGARQRLGRTEGNQQVTFTDGVFFARWSGTADVQVKMGEGVWVRCSPATGSILQKAEELLGVKSP